MLHAFRARICFAGSNLELEVGSCSYDFIITIYGHKCYLIWFEITVRFETNWRFDNEKFSFNCAVSIEC
jgi:hypothetical protein